MFLGKTLLSQCLSPPGFIGTGEFISGGNPAMDWHPIQGGVEKPLITSCYRNRDILLPDGPPGAYAEVTFHCTNIHMDLSDILR